jgi:hypothetical protein
LKKRIIVRGPALSRSGYGEQCRFALRSLRAHEDRFDIFLENTNWGRTNCMTERTEESQWIEMLIQKTHFYMSSGGMFDISLQVTIPNEWTKKAPINIGYTAGIETTKISPQWVEKSEIMDKIIVVSSFAKEAFANTVYQAEDTETGEVFPEFKVRTPIIPVNYCCKAFKTHDLGINLESNFNFLTVAQWGPRKNLDKTVKWFVEEFHQNEDVGLIIKSNKANNSTMDKTATEHKLRSVLHTLDNKDYKCKIYLMHGSMTDEEMTSLYTHPKVKAYLTLAHGEGFGLPLFEAAQQGLPILAPDWSGHMDFLCMPIKDKKGKTKIKPMFAKVDYTLQNVQREAVWDGVVQADSKWAYADKFSYKKRLMEVYKDLGRFESQAKKLQSWILENFKSDDKYKEFVEAILGEEEMQIEPQADQVVVL